MGHHRPAQGTLVGLAAYGAPGVWGQMLPAATGHFLDALLVVLPALACSHCRAGFLYWLGEV